MPIVTLTRSMLGLNPIPRSHMTVIVQKDPLKPSISGSFAAFLCGVYLGMYFGTPMPMKLYLISIQCKHGYLSARFNFQIIAEVCGIP